MEISTQYEEKSKQELLAIIDQQSQRIATLTELLRLSQHRRFANQSEKVSPDQLSFFDEAESVKNKKAIIAADEEIAIVAHTRKKNVGRKPLPADLPREQRIYDLAESEKNFACGKVLTHIKDETSEQLEIVPAKIIVIQHVRKKYACKACEETIKTAPMPAQPIPRSIASPGLLSHIIVSKFQDYCVPRIHLN